MRRFLTTVKFKSELCLSVHFILRKSAILKINKEAYK